MTEQPQEEFNALEYKLLALKERISLIVTDYEDKDSDKRVQITYLTLENTRLTNEIQELKAKIDELEAKPTKSGK